MILFWLTTLIFLLIPIFVLIKSLLNKNNKNVNIAKSNEELYDQKLSEIHFDVKNRLITENEANIAIKELESSLKKDNENINLSNSKLQILNIKSKRILSLLILFILPVFVFTIYIFIGNPNSIEKSLLSEDLENIGNNNEDLASLDEMLNRVEKRLLDNQDNIDDWLMLANSYTVLKRYPEAIRAFENLYRLKGDDPSLLFRYADVLAMANSGIFKGKPEMLIKKAMELDPDNTMGLWLAGLVAYENKKVNDAISYWEKVLPKLEKGSDDEKNIKKYIQFARNSNEIINDNEKINGNSAIDMTDKHSLNLYVQLSSNFDNIDKNKTVFIYAKPINSDNNIPIIVLRKTVADLPLSIKMDNSMSMIPTNKLSSHELVQVSARVSMSGNAISEKGDLIGIVNSMSTTSQNITKLIIDREIE